MNKEQAKRGHLGGLQKSDKKTTAVRNNGKQGGRPKDDNPSPAALRQREYRERKKNALERQN